MEKIFMKTRTITAFLSIFFTQLLLAHDLPIKISKEMDAKNSAIIANVLEEVAEILPAKLKAGLPSNLELRFDKLSDHKNIPSDVCFVKLDSDKTNKKKISIRPFIYGEYNHNKKLLILNLPVLNELAKGRANSEKINCQHKTLYDQSISTIIHELTHAYDFNNDNLSNTTEFLLRANFKKDLLKTKNKNIDPMRSADPYELTSNSEAYAVNLEYFLMDSEFACRKPTMFDYFKRTFEFDPYPNRNCEQNNIVMMSTAAGYYPVNLDPQRVYRIDYLLAAPGNDLSSGFGHSMFRVVVCAPEHFDVITNKIISATPFGPKCLNDRLFHVVVSYRANVEGATLNYFKGIFGGYPSMLFMLNFGDVLDEYNRDQLRDVLSYPLNLNFKEKNDFMRKVIEEHWNYRGAYKFVTNNCAVESFDLLKSALATSDFKGLNSITPRGVLKDLDQLEFLSLKSNSQESFMARTEQLVLAYNEIYGGNEQRIQSNTKKSKKILLDFIKESSSLDRIEKFTTFSSMRVENMDLYTKVRLLKKSLVKASSFSVMEQQILLSKISEFRKKAAELFMETDSTRSKDERIKKLLEESNIAFKQNLSDLAFSGYGVPLPQEMLSRQDIDQKIELSKETIANIEIVLKELMPKEIAILESIRANIMVFNKKSLEIRKEYREKLDLYIHQMLIKLAHQDDNRTLLINSLTSNNDIKKIRDLLDINLVNEKEILDVKLRNIIKEILN